MRFAGSRIEGFMGGDESPNFGEMAQKGLAIRNKESTTTTDLMGKTAATGIQAAGDVEASKITGEAATALAKAQGQASMMSSIGEIGSSLIGGMGSSGGGGSYGSNIQIGDLNKYADAFNNPNTYNFSLFDN